uniref:NAD(P)-binding domain-containing protein n=1 Tax=Chromera velia CCMP2878 TaxID=1169474 RepID=A0A0G4G889_9ALVE|mmetsp:Transcript_6334/g.12571  ORF Transcript_6334/g.12571 Transcript_6334/m.12571 type:complete len:313 (+) Transcript_6334:112-1050(+)|eukprot:Cvel_4352.t1-p1 / transcript=Cvel_4352.t1 / gene=Cvel_4352 / organism=Chromera_velia_CCMP2878 / gene_product=Uncharacterized protein At5g02240, putative / transcript_product=Uncharacterized protein At5g02240, putative / location=Cvel_scaffold188:115998-117201(+) / protein_length=312 / sequence_SO=supercontig / SO=protein_coding / is_pseudo=false
MRLRLLPLASLPLLLFCGSLLMKEAEALRVLVTGAGGRTGKIVLRKLAERADVEAVGQVRNKKSARQLEKWLGKEVKDSVRVVEGDILKLESLNETMKGCDAVVLCTSAVPKPKVLSLLSVILFNSVVKALGYKPWQLKFLWKGNGFPKEVDYDGAVNQINAAKKAGVKKFVFLGSMGGSQPDNFLNSVAKDPQTGERGDILLWKRKAERYLIESGIPYTIIHPGGLEDKPGREREVLIGVNDILLKRKYKGIPREDVAEMCVTSLFCDAARNKAFDICTNPEGEGEATKDFCSLIGSLREAYSYAGSAEPK